MSFPSHSNDADIGHVEASSPASRYPPGVEDIINRGPDNATPEERHRGILMRSLLDFDFTTATSNHTARACSPPLSPLMSPTHFGDFSTQRRQQEDEREEDLLSSSSKTIRCLPSAAVAAAVAAASTTTTIPHTYSRRRTCQEATHLQLSNHIFGIRRLHDGIDQILSMFFCRLHIHMSIPSSRHLRRSLRHLLAAVKLLVEILPLLSDAQCESYLVAPEVFDLINNANNKTDTSSHSSVDENGTPLNISSSIDSVLTQGFSLTSSWTRRDLESARHKPIDYLHGAALKERKQTIIASDPLAKRLSEHVDVVRELVDRVRTDLNTEIETVRRQIELDGYYD